jgi:hypothetical protein
MALMAVSWLYVDHDYSKPFHWKELLKGKQKGSNPKVTAFGMELSAFFF